jgi:hypothetical protein
LRKRGKFIEKVADRKEEKEKNLQKRFGENKITVTFATRLKNGIRSLKISKLNRSRIKIL